MATRILQGPVVKDRADRTDSTVAGDQLRGAGDIQELPEGVIRLSDPSVGATARGGPAAVAWPIAHRGRVTWIDVRGKVDKDRFLWAAVAAVTRGQRFLEQPTIGGRVLWVSQEAAADLKAQLAEVDADLDKVFFIRGPRPDTDDESSLPRIVALLRPVWVIIDPWQHYVQVQRVTAAAGPGAEKLLLGDIVDWAREYEVAVTVSHDNEKNRPGAYTDSAVLGATDMVVSLGPGKSPTTLRLQPSGRWQDPVDIRRTLGGGYSVVKGTEQAGRSRTDARRIDDRVMLHLYELGADTRLSARRLAASLACQGRRYEELSSALDRLLAEGIVDRAQGSGASSGRGYALTERGRRRAECLRQASDSGASTTREASAACSAVASVSAAFPEVSRSGNATTPARETSAEGCSETVSEAAFPGVSRSGNATTSARETSAESCSETVSEAAFPGVEPNRKRDDVRWRGVGGGLFGDRFRGCVSRGEPKRKRDARWRGVGGVFGGRDRFRRSRARRRRDGWGWVGGAREATELYATARRSPAALVSAAWRERAPTDVQNRTHAFPIQRPVGRGGESSVQPAGRSRIPPQGPVAVLPGALLRAHRERA